MKIRELSPGFHHPRMPIVRQLLLAVVVGLELISSIGAFAFVCIWLLGGFIGLGAGLAGSFYMLITESSSVGYAILFILAARAFIWLGNRIAGPYKAVRISELVEDDAT